MKRRVIIILIIVAVVVALLTAGIVYLKQYLPKYRWYPTYSYKSDEPYGTNYLYELLSKKFEDKSFKMLTKNPSSMIDEEESNSLLFYIGYRTMYDSTTIEWFKTYMQKGNKVCIASDVLPFQLLNNIYNLDTSLFYIESYSSTTIETRFIGNETGSYCFHHQFVKDTTPFEWSYISKTTMEEYWKNYLYDPLSTIDSGRVNFLEIEYGDGALYIYTTPLCLTNYYFITEQGFDYANEFFSNLDNFNTLYWDDYSRLPEMFNSKRSPINLNNPLEFILENTALRWAWYLFLLGIVLFSLFKLKRRQKPIAIISTDKNTSIEYAKAVGLLHYKTSTHLELANRLMKIFQHYINSRYGISLSLEQEEQIKKISIQSGLKRHYIENIYTSHFKIKYNPTPEKNQTIKLHAELEYFYNNCK